VLTFDARKMLRPYFWSSIAWMKNLHTLSVVVFGFPCLLMTTFRSFSSSHSALVSFFLTSSSSSLSRLSVYKLLFSVLRSTLGSCENLHFLPFSQLPFLKNWQRMVFGSTPNGTFWIWTGLKRSATSLAACAAAAFSFSFCSFSACFFFSSGVPPDDVALICLICLCAAPPFLFFMPKVLSTATFFTLGCSPLPFGGILTGADAK
jgi:hypothetical protein